ncbi:MAG: Single-stranded DNA binding protein [Methanosarcinaceae archaeon]|nr:Single-stranded DNA binding protein [Methanosarcinaceae archaeon]
MKRNIAPHIDELTKALENIDRSEIENELYKLLEFRVPIDEAKRSIIRKFGSRSASVKKIEDISIGDQGFETTVRIIEVRERVVRVRNRDATIFSGILADGTGLCYFNSWHDFSLNENDVVCIKNISVKNWNGRMEINLGDRSKVIKLSDDILPSINELSRATSKKLIDIDHSDVFVSSLCIVVELYHRNIDTRDGEIMITEGVLADDTGKLPFVAWIPLENIDIGTVVDIKGASVRMFRGVPSIYFNKNTDVSIVGGSDPLPFTLESVSAPPVPIPIENMLHKEGMFDVALRGNIISVRPGSGIVTRCPICNRVIMKGTCRAHGSVEGIQDMRIKMVVDDGTGSIMVMLDRDLSEIVYGKTMLEVKGSQGRSISQDVVYENMKQVLIGKYIGARGNTSSTEFGVSIVASSVWDPEDDLAGRVNTLFERLTETGM